MGGSAKVEGSLHCIFGVRVLVRFQPNGAGAPGGFSVGLRG